jgi:hypothetical protein
MNDASRVVRGLEDEPPLPLSDAAYAMLELLPSQMTVLLHGTEASSDIGIWGFVTECHRLALSKHVADFGPDDIVALIRRHPRADGTAWRCSRAMSQTGGGNASPMRERTSSAG